jgi:hypothetical protein
MPDLPVVDIRPELLAHVPDAVELVDAYRRSWIANGLPEDHNLNEALGVLVAASSFATRMWAQRQAVLDLCTGDCWRGG